MSVREVSRYLVPAFVICLLLTGTGWALVSEEDRAKAPRVSVDYAHQAVQSGRALLVCAYPDVEVCQKVMLRGAITLKELESRLPGLKKDQEIIFYCA